MKMILRAVWVLHYYLQYIGGNKRGKIVVRLKKKRRRRREKKKTRQQVSKTVSQSIKACMRTAADGCIYFLLLIFLTGFSRESVTSHVKGKNLKTYGTSTNIILKQQNAKINKQAGRLIGG